MDLFNVFLTPFAEEQIDSYIDYIQYDLGNTEAAISVYEDMRETKNRLKYVAPSLPFCQNPKLSKYGYRKIFLQHHDYVMMYVVQSNNVYIDAVYHTLQDYENTFMEDYHL